MAGCSSTDSAEPSRSPKSSESSIAPSSVSVEPKKATTIEEVWAKMGCTQGQMILPVNPGTGMTRNGVCSPHGNDSKNAFFYEFPSEARATEWLKSGGLQIGPTEAVFTAGSVVVLVTDAASAKELAAVFTPHTG